MGNPPPSPKCGSLGGQTDFSWPWPCPSRCWRRRRRSRKKPCGDRADAGGLWLLRMSDAGCCGTAASHHVFSGRSLRPRLSILYHEHRLVRVSQLPRWGLWSPAAAARRSWHIPGHGEGAPGLWPCPGMMPLLSAPPSPQQLSSHARVEVMAPAHPKQRFLLHPSRNWPLQDSRSASFPLMDF